MRLCKQSWIFFEMNPAELTTWAVIRFCRFLPYQRVSLTMNCAPAVATDCKAVVTSPITRMEMHGSTSCGGTGTIIFILEHRHFGKRLSTPSLYDLLEVFSANGA